MVLFNFIYALVFVFLKVDDGYGMRYMKQESFEDYEKLCDKVVLRPFFKNELVINLQWRVYYAWNVLPDSSCRDMSFKKSNPLLVNHVRSEMSRYLQSQPHWADASLFLTMSRYRHLLLIKDESGIPGSFIQIPNILHNVWASIPDEGQIPLFRMVLKLVLDGRYLIMSDCSDGVTFLLGHRSESPLWGEIRTVALNYNYGPGMPSCARS